MLLTLGFLAYWGMFGMFHGGIGFLFMILFLMFLFSGARRRGGYYSRGPRGYGSNYRRYYSPPPPGAPRGDAPQVTQESPRTESGPYYGKSPTSTGEYGTDGAGERTIRIEPGATAERPANGSDTIRVDTPGSSGEPTRPL